MMFALPQPTKETFLENGIEFGKKWNFPNTMGCLDGKHIRIRCPNNTGSLYYNYKDFFSIVLFALVGPNYKFIAVDIGSFGREGDAGSLFRFSTKTTNFKNICTIYSAGIFSKCNLGKAIKNKLFDTPGPTVLPNSQTVMPHIFLGDEAFPILDNLLKPYPRDQSLHDRSKAVFNYRLSRARRIVENAFGILSQCFRIFYTPIQLSVDTIEDLVTVACILHNLMIEEHGTPEFYDEAQLDSIVQRDEIEMEIENGSNQELKYRIRDTFKEYFNTDGSVSWQNDTFRL